ncbi:MAG: hypothetical protein AVO39_08175 [delta proteobacterium MLS_D]|jgi:peptidoglycan-associated lipoprotein|nr:MAG: hypothetical protein AVO39_08175 [delta proteobacterium MLS_D]
MKRNWQILGRLVVVSTVLVFVLSGCYCFKETAVKETPPPAQEKAAEAKAPAPAPAKKADDEAAKAKAKALYEKQVAEAKTFAERPIHFDFDRYDLKPQARAALDELGAWLLKNKNFDVLVEGHCDERGTAEYNLALGERRATATRDYLVKLGVDADRLSTVSYGEENPVDPRSNEEAWAKNRRAELNVFPTSWYK